METAHDDLGEELDPNSLKLSGRNNPAVQARAFLDGLYISVTFNNHPDTGLTVLVPWSEINRARDAKAKMTLAKIPLMGVVTEFKGETVADYHPPG